MVIQARLKIRHHGCVSEKVRDGARIIHMSGDDRRCLSVFKATSEEQLEELLAGTERMLEPDGIVDRASDWAVVHCHCPREGSRIMPVIRSFQCTPIWPVIEAEGHEYYTVVAPSRKRLRDLVDALSTQGEIEVERANTVAGGALDVAIPLSDVTQHLTRRQLDALKTAVAGGYYDSPKGAYAEELARAMGMSRSTFQEHLQKAEAVVMRAFTSLALEHPALDAQAMKPRGRPKATIVNGKRA